MRWKNTLYLKDKAGEIRVRRKFLWFPTSFGRTRTRWFCFADVVEKVQRNRRYGSTYIEDYWEWVPIDFNDDEDKMTEIYEDD